ncbi:MULTISPECIES: hypothetical protein [unclassified Streptomyces]
MTLQESVLRRVTGEGLDAARITSFFVSCSGERNRNSAAPC